MRIVIDARFWSESGIGRYLRNLVKELRELDRDNEYFVLHLKKDFEDVAYEGNFQKVAADFKWYGAAEQIKLPMLLKSLKPDLVHLPHFNIPVVYQGKFVVTIHDLIHQHFQTRETTTRSFLVHGIKKTGYGLAFSQAVKRASKIMTPSDFVKKQLEKEWKVDGSKVVVTPEGVDKGLLRVIGDIRDGDGTKVLGKFGISKRYLFYVGNAQPHKNILGMVKVFRILREKYPDLTLVLAGPEHKFWDRVIGETGEMEGVVFTGFVSEEELVVLYKNAQAFVMPSLEEGFGIPVLEAMACGCPVVSSHAGSLPEVGGEAAIYFDPQDKREMAEKISQILEDNKLREELIVKGLQRYKEFSWKEMAIRTLQIYDEVSS